MEQTGSGVAVEGAAQAEGTEKRLQPGHVGGQIRGPHGGVLDAGDGLGVALAAGEKGQAGFAHVPNQGDLGGVVKNGSAKTEAFLRQQGKAFGYILIEELHHQDGFARFEVQFEQVARGLEGKLAAGLIEQHTVNMFNGGGFQGQEFDDGLHGLGDGGEENQAQAPDCGLGNNFKFGGENGGQRAFAPGQKMAQIIRVAQETIQAVARPAFQQAWGKLLFNRGGLVANAPGEKPALGGQGFPQRAGLLDAPVGEDDFEGENVIVRDAVNRHMGAGGVVGDHAAQSGARTGGHIGSETEAARFEESVELVQDHARANAHGAAFEVQSADLAVVAGEINDHARADRAAGQARARAARDDGEARFRRGADDGSRLGGVAREGDGQRLDLIKRSVGGVKLARQVVERDLAIRGRERGTLTGRNGANRFDVETLSAELEDDKPATTYLASGRIMV